MPIKEAYPDPTQIADRVLAYFNDNYGHLWNLNGDVQIKHMLWSVLYFITVTNGEKTQKLVVKIIRFPNQTDPAVSWTNDELLLRGSREYASMERINSLFHDQGANGLYCIPPVVYIAEINAIVMGYVEGQSLYHSSLTLSRLLRPGASAHARILLKNTGRWLRQLHSLPLGEVPAERQRRQADSVQAIVVEVDKLKSHSVSLDAFPDWHKTLDILHSLSDDKQVWAHGDFHMRNVLVPKGDDILCFDTAFEFTDSPYYDMGTFIADLKSRRSRILRWGLLPSDHETRVLSGAFLSGYFQNEPWDVRLLSLYEGRFLLQKWNESLEVIDDKFYGARKVAGDVLRAGVVDLTFRRIVQRWMRDIVTFRP
ncbi:MAG: phosphotransferase [Anaerolineae bacterium]